MLLHFLFYLLLAANLINLIHLGFYINGSNIYDIKKFLKENKNIKKSEDKTFSPLVSVVIPAHNEAQVIQRTLDSVWASSYSNIEVIVIDDGSTDNTVKIVRDHISKLPSTTTKTYFGRTSSHFFIRRDQYESKQSIVRRFLRVPNKKIRTFSVIQSNGGKASAMNNAIANHVSGEFVMCLDADSILDRYAIERAMVYFQDKKIIGVAANVRVMESKKLIIIAQRFEHMIGYRSKKFYSITNSEFIIGGVASTYRVNALKGVNLYDTDTLTEDIGLSLKLISKVGNKNKRIIYADDVVAYTEGVQTFKALLTQRYRWKMGSLQNIYKYKHLIGRGQNKKHSHMLTKYRLPMAIISEIMLIFEPLLLFYIIYISISHKTLAVVLGAYLTITLYVLWNIWPDEHLNIRQKIKMSLLGLFIYGLFFIIDVVQIAAIFKCLWNFNRVTKRTSGETWISPARLGQSSS